MLKDNGCPTIDEKCPQRQTLEDHEMQNGETNGKIFKKNRESAFHVEFEQLVREIEIVENESGLKDAFLFLEFDKYYNSWNKPDKTDDT